MKIDKKYRLIDQENMADLVATFKKRNEDALKKKSKIEIASSLIETCPELIPSTVAEVTTRHKKFQKMAKSSGLPSLGSKEFKSAIMACIKHLLQLSMPELVNNTDFNLSPSLTAAECNSKLSKVLLLYKLALPAIRQYVVYD